MGADGSPFTRTERVVEEMWLWIRLMKGAMRGLTMKGALTMKPHSMVSSWSDNLGLVFLHFLRSRGRNLVFWWKGRWEDLCQLVVAISLKSYSISHQFTNLKGFLVLILLPWRTPRIGA